jgi:hypothetical protein
MYYVVVISPSVKFQYLSHVFDSVRVHCDAFLTTPGVEVGRSEVRQFMRATTD